ncbi:MAG: YHYH protein [Granulosicoccus sp.]
MLTGACSSDDTTADTVEGTDLNTDPVSDNADNATTTTVVFNCEEIATKFVTRGSANAELDDPSVSATCEGDTVTVRANGIPDFPYIATSPGVPQGNDTEYVFPATPAPADQATEIPIVGAIGVAINGVPISGPTEGPGGDVNSRPGGFNECGGHNGPTGYHYHLFDVTGSDYCLFSETDVASEPVLFGYALDGYPIFSGNTRYRSSWYLSDAALYATDTWSAHAYSAGSGDLDQCNGRTDESGNYAYYTTDDFPYIMGCFRGDVSLPTREGEPRPAQ